MRKKNPLGKGCTGIMTMREIAELTGTSPSTVNHILGKICQKMLRRMYPHALEGKTEMEMYAISANFRPTFDRLMLDYAALHGKKFEVPIHFLQYEDS